MNEIDIKDEIIFIKKVIEESKRTAIGEKLISIVWGLILVICLFLIFLFSIRIHNISVEWYAIPLTCLGWLYTVYVIIKSKKQSPVKTFGGRILYSVWIACGIVITCFVFIVPSLGFIATWRSIPICCMIAGIGYYVMSDITANRVTKIFAILWWIGGLVMMIWPGYYQLLLCPGMIIFLILIPDIKYHMDWKKQQKGITK
jgi:hypothetical protein